MIPNTPIKKPKSGSCLQPAPGFFRRLAAVFYDLLLLIAVFFVATALLLPLNSGEAFTPQQPFYPIYLLTVSFLFYGWFWTHGGQTLGLKAWKMRVLTLDQKPINWTQAFIRYVAALVSWTMLGLGFIWILFDKNRRGWHDHLSRTAVFFDAQKK
ncbi:MAG: RDD family protein [Methylovulum miyakonense]|uniref:RDD family protein n=1 Tax=Methylovulum miyakonense TaxID=645578 RepID=UPI003BB4BD36